MIGLGIWNRDTSPDVYVDFKVDFDITQVGEVKVNVSCDGSFVLRLNGERVGFGSCANYPDYKQCYTFDIGDKVSLHNTLIIGVWHQGIDSSTQIAQEPYLTYEIVADGVVVAHSSKDTMCRTNANYTPHRGILITKQQGMSYCYDNRGYDTEWGECVECGEIKSYHNGTHNLIMRDRAPISITETNVGYLIDMGREIAGFLEIDIRSDTEQEIAIAYGEHILDGGVRYDMGEYQFVVRSILKAGDNKCICDYKRIAGRYIEVYTKDIRINYLGIREVEYPTIDKPYRFKDDLARKIYEVSSYTLKCCMHEHYEDCPWREQALYNMDSRNQMLCGYFAYEGHEYQRANLVLISKGLLPMGLLNICFPSGEVLPIPSFSLVYLTQIKEYIQYTGDRSILDDIGDTLTTIIGTFTKHIDSTGLIPNLPSPCWNFYEWSDGSHNVDEISNRGDRGLKYDLLLNVMYVYALGQYDEIYGTHTDTTSIKKAIKEHFYDESVGLYRLNTVEHKYSVLGNSLAVLIGLGGKEITDKLKEDKSVIPITLSMCTFMYDALLKVDSEAKDYILADIGRKYKAMLDKGATTFWETEKGAEDMDGAGSMCHGWSAMPIYYYNVLGVCK